MAGFFLCLNFSHFFRNKSYTFAQSISWNEIFSVDPAFMYFPISLGATRFDSSQKRNRFFATRGQRFPFKAIKGYYFKGFHKTWPQGEGT